MAGACAAAARSSEASMSDSNHFLNHGDTHNVMKNTLNMDAREKK